VQALSSGAGHLLGRALILEWAKEEENVDALRERTVSQFSARERAASAQSADELAATANTAAARKRRKIAADAADHQHVSFANQFNANT